MVKLLKPKVRLARRWFKRVGIVSCLLSLVALVFYLVFKSDFLGIKNINCWVKDKTSIADEERWCGAIKREILGQKIPYLKTEAIASEIRNKFLPVGEVKITKKYPQTVLVQIVERKPIAKVSPPGGREFLVDKEGVIYSEVLPEFQNLPRVVLELGFELASGQKLEPEIVGLILLEESPVSAIKFVGQEGIEVKANGNLVILFSRAKNLANQIRSLQMILQKYRIEGKSLKQVDLRYEQPVIKY